MNIDRGYAFERTHAALFALTTMASPVERLAAAVHELTLLNHHNDQLSLQGKGLLDEILSLVPLDSNWEESIREMHHTRRDRLAKLIRDLYLDTLQLPQIEMQA